MQDITQSLLLPMIPTRAIKRVRLGRQSFRLLCHPFLLIAFAFSHLMPRDRNLWVFGLPKRFSWNSKYLFLHIANQKPGAVKVLWIVRDQKMAQELMSQGYPAALWWEPKALWGCLRAKYFIADAYLNTINFWLSGGAREVLLWHGIPLKKLEKDIKIGESIEVLLLQSRGLQKAFFRLLLPWRFRKPDYMTATSPAFQEIFAWAFGVPKENVFIAGFPKNDILFEPVQGADIGADQNALEILKKFRQKVPAGKVVLYAPTWRDTGGDSFFEKTEDLLILDAFLREHNILLLFKAHPATRQNTIRELVSSQGVRNIVLVDPQSDADPLLARIDVLVTDYSGIFFEFLLLDRPVIFFPFDYEKYVSKDRELYFPYDEITPGPKVKTLGELCAALQNATQGKDEWREARKKVRDLCFTFQDGRNAERVFEAIRKLP